MHSCQTHCNSLNTFRICTAEPLRQFTKWVEAYALPDQGAETVARALTFEFLTHYKAPLSIHTDQGRNFDSELFHRIRTLFEAMKT